MFLQRLVQEKPQLCLFKPHYEQFSVSIIYCIKPARFFCFPLFYETAYSLTGFCSTPVSMKSHTNGKSWKLSTLLKELHSKYFRCRNSSRFRPAQRRWNSWLYATLHHVPLYCSAAVKNNNYYRYPYTKVKEVSYLILHADNTDVTTLLILNLHSCAVFLFPTKLSLCFSLCCTEEKLKSFIEGNAQYQSRFSNDLYSRCFRSSDICRFKLTQAWWNLL